MLQILTQEFLLPAGWFILFTFILGMIFGSFLDVCICRFHTGKSIGGSSHCMSCGKQLRWYELFPFMSYVIQLGRCRECGSRIPARLFLMELVTGSLFVFVLVQATTLIELVWLLAVGLVLLFIVIYDYLHFIIPDEMTLVLLSLTGGWLGYEWLRGGINNEQLLWTIGASVVGAVFFLLIWLVTKGRGLGFGDVKLAVPLGLWVGATGVFSFIVLSFWVGAVISIGILLYQRYGRGKQFLHMRRETLTMKSAVPFAPFMIIGATLVYFFNLDVLSLFSFTY